jgi:hypothetical protein
VARSGRLLHDVAHDGIEHVGGGASRPHAEHRRQLPQDAVEQELVAAKVAAGDLGHLAGTGHPADRHAQPRRGRQDIGDRHRLDGVGVAHHVAMAVRQHDDVAGDGVDALVASGHPRSAGADGVKDDQPFGAGGKQPDKVRRIR